MRCGSGSRAPPIGAVGGRRATSAGRARRTAGGSRAALARACPAPSAAAAGARPATPVQCSEWHANRGRRNARVGCENRGVVLLRVRDAPPPPHRRRRGFAHRGGERLMHISQQCAAPRGVETGARVCTVVYVTRCVPPLGCTAATPSLRHGEPTTQWQRAASSLRRHRPALAPAAAPGRVRRERAGGGPVAPAPGRQGGTPRAARRQRPGPVATALWAGLRVALCACEREDRRMGGT